jgi:hypothetical protein
MLNDRIRLQQLLHLGNRLPHAEKAAAIIEENTDVQEAFQEASSAMFNLLSDMVDYRSVYFLTLF